MTKPPALKDLIAAEPDLVDRIFDYILSEFPQIAGQPPEKIATTKAAVRAEFRGEECYIAARPPTARQQLVTQVLALFNVCWDAGIIKLICLPSASSGV